MGTGSISPPSSPSGTCASQELGELHALHAKCPDGLAKPGVTYNEVNLYILTALEEMDKKLDRHKDGAVAKKSAAPQRRPDTRASKRRLTAAAVLAPRPCIGR